jgi:hypothetical protein
MIIVLVASFVLLLGAIVADFISEWRHPGLFGRGRGRR